MDMFNNQVDFDNIDISEWKSNNNLLDAFENEYLSLQYTNETDDVSTNDMFDTDIENDSKNLNETATVKVPPKIFEIIRDKKDHQK